MFALMVLCKHNIAPDFTHYEMCYIMHEIIGYLVRIRYFFRTVSRWGRIQTCL